MTTNVVVPTETTIAVPAVHRRAVVFDALSISSVLNDDVAERYLAGGVTATNMSIILEHGWDEALRAIDHTLSTIEHSPYLVLATSVEHITRAKELGRLAVFLGSQGASFIDNQNDRQLYRLALLSRLGLRFFGLVYTSRNLLGDGCGERTDGGLSFLGQDVVDAANELPLAVDVSHCSHRTRQEAAERARVPVCTHSNAFELVPNARNTMQETAALIARKGGVIGVAALPRIVSPLDAAVEGVLDHIDHFVRTIGVRSVGLGLDFVETSRQQLEGLPSTTRWRSLRPDIFGDLADFGRKPYPRGIETIERLPRLTNGLLDRGYDENDVRRILGQNWLELIAKLERPRA